VEKSVTNYALDETLIYKLRSLLLRSFVIVVSLKKTSAPLSQICEERTRENMLHTFLELSNRTLNSPLHFKGEVSLPQQQAVTPFANYKESIIEPGTR